MPQPTASPAGDTTAILASMSAGDPAAAERLLPIVYQELRKIAGACFRDQDRGQTLQPTALVHEAYLRLIHPGASFKDRTHFMAVAARAMRQILIDRARRAAAGVHGGGRRRVPLSNQFRAPDVSAAPDVLVVHEVMTELARLDGRKARVVEMRIFGGMSIEEVAEALDISRTTVTKDWRMARAWLAQALDERSGE